MDPLHAPRRFRPSVVIGQRLSIVSSELQRMTSESHNAGELPAESAADRSALND